MTKNSMDENTNAKNMEIGIVNILILLANV